MVTLYSEVKDEIKTGDLLAWKTTKIEDFFDLFLFLYQKIFNAKYTHTAIAVRMGSRVLMVEATPPVVRLFPVSMSKDFYLIKTNIKFKESHIDSLLIRLGRKYSVLDFLRGKLKLKLSSKEDYCSDMNNEFYNEIGYLNDEDAGLTPDTLVEAVIKASGNEPIFIKLDKGNLQNGI